ncbi:uncharacterized protein LOC107268664 [Cephus cinctus]|uniref:Uncharacterized protein LOC107268664 n=1 Tax=Cephus cinctus TaxID=211228 RepID=A0AAJ7RIT1_CEPCN|nr:uncharacterized protein LOC107268664 [Cephus cinctus]
MNCPFTIKWINGVESTMTDLCIICKLQPAEKTIFKIEFVPSQRGRFSLEAPIFVKGELEGNMFNCLQLYGDNPISSIDSDTCEIYFFPIPLKNEAEEKITLTFSHYKSTVNVVASILAPIKCSGIMKENTLKILFPNGNTISGTRR